MNEKIIFKVNLVEGQFAGKTIKGIREAIAGALGIPQDRKIIYIVTREVEIVCPEPGVLHELISNQKPYWKGSMVKSVVMKARLSKQVRSNYKIRAGEELEIMVACGKKC